MSKRAEEAAMSYTGYCRNEAYKHFIKGYEKAEKDLALTWEDIRKICTLSVIVEMGLGREVSDKKHYEEVLKRFNEYKEERK